MVVFKSLDLGTSNVDPENEEQPVEGTTPVEADPKPTAPSASRDQSTVVITLEALQSLVESRVDQAVQNRVDQVAQAALAGLGSQAAPTTSISSQATPVSKAPVVIPPTSSTELPGTAVVTEAPPQVVTYGRQCMTEESEYIRYFMKLTPPTFGGKGTDPEAAEWWLECIETKFTFFNCPENHKVLCATYLLEGPAHFLWKSKKPKMKAGGALIAWATIKHEFCEKYYPALARL
ncbi:hypothetical protein SDJN03_06980, partial [Cucurbita argyrosperma subsp. sororia]